MNTSPNLKSCEKLELELSWISSTFQPFSDPTVIYLELLQPFKTHLQQAKANFLKCLSLPTYVVFGKVMFLVVSAYLSIQMG